MNNESDLTLAFSTCPNDTFIFHALIHGRIDCKSIRFKQVLKDVETLNQDARHQRYDITKLSFAAIGRLLDTYGLLRSGAALGRGCGPLIVATPGVNLADLTSVVIAVPGLWTTAHLLLQLFMNGAADVVPMTFDQIMPLIQTGSYQAGVIIHEGRFTYPDYGLSCLQDLGAWWEEKTGLPIPLGGIAMRRDLGTERILAVETAIRESVKYAFDHTDASAAYIRQHAQEMSPDVIRRHIDLYVNPFSIDLGEQGQEAVTRLFDLAVQRGVFPRSRHSLFAVQE